MTPAGDVPVQASTDLPPAAWPCGLVTAAEASQLEQKWNMSLSQVMFKLVASAEQLARPVISHYPVGAVALGATTGNLYFGANIEFAGQALSLTTHAEQSAINNAWLNGEQGVDLLAVSAAPCGYCRQFLYELDTAAALGVVLAMDQTVGLTGLLPLPFGPGNMGVKSALMSPTDNGLTIDPAPTDPLVIAALGAANASYSPYPNGIFAGVALETSEGTTFLGRFAHNAAYNPSLSPMESALALKAVCGNADAIARAVLVETTSPADQTGASRLVLASVAPSVTLEVVIVS